MAEQFLNNEQYLNNTKILWNRLVPQYQSTLPWEKGCWDTPGRSMIHPGISLPLLYLRTHMGSTHCMNITPTSVNYWGRGRLPPSLDGGGLAGGHMTTQPLPPSYTLLGV